MAWRPLNIVPQLLSVYTGRREESLSPVSIPVTDLKVLLRLAREQYLVMHDGCLPRATSLIAEKENHAREAPGKALQQDPFTLSL